MMPKKFTAAMGTAIVNALKGPFPKGVEPVMLVAYCPDTLRVSYSACCCIAVLDCVNDMYLFVGVV
jgi:hypothetical protein